MATLSKFGWLLSGLVNNLPPETFCNPVVTHSLRVDASERTMEVTGEEPLDNHVKQYFKLESLGINSEETSVHDRFVEDIEFDGTRYVVKLPFKDDVPLLPDNYQNSLNGLKGLVKRLKGDPELFREYDDIIKQTNNQILEDVDLSKPTMLGRVHYLPHHPVIKPDRATSKVRIVYDASSKSSRDVPSLNEVLYAGPSFIPPIMDVPIRFRWHKISLTSDIQKAFLMISINEAHRDLLRMIWIDDIHNDNPNLLIKRFQRVVFGVKPSPFLLNGTMKYHIEKYESVDPQFVEQFLATIYVDDLITGNETVSEVFSFYPKAKEKLSEVGFNLHKFATNSPKLFNLIQRKEANNDKIESSEQVFSDENETYTKSALNVNEKLTEQSETKVLGHVWNFQSDEICFQIKNILDIAEKTHLMKRGVLSIMAHVYDPLGLIPPAMSRLKFLFRELCKLDLSWDSPLPMTLKDQYVDWISCLPTISVLSVPQCYF